jgi:hypothetical protein
MRLGPEVVVDIVIYSSITLSIRRRHGELMSRQEQSGASGQADRSRHTVFFKL